MCMKRFTVGWTKEEETLLADAAARARRERQPLRTVFEQVASQTGRRPNSVRNHYYARQKPENAEPAFIPFTEEESRSLLKAVLAAQAAGESVRACTLRLAGGDTRRMLRYQNKYRQLLRTRPEAVHAAIEQLACEGKRALDPYAAAPAVRRPGRPQAQSSAGLEATIRQLVTALYDTMLALAERNTSA